MPDTTDLLETVQALREELRRMQQGRVPDRRWYAISDDYREPRIRLASGRDPAFMTREEQEYFLSIAPSGSTFARWRRGGVVRCLTIGSQRKMITEIEMQNLEAALEQGHVVGYQLPPEHRK